MLAPGPPPPRSSPARSGLHVAAWRVPPAARASATAARGPTRRCGRAYSCWTRVQCPPKPAMLGDLWTTELFFAAGGGRNLPCDVEEQRKKMLAEMGRGGKKVSPGSVLG